MKRPPLLTLKVIDGWLRRDQERIARRLGISLNTLRRRLYAARRAGGVK